MKKYETDLTNDLGIPGSFKAIDLIDDPKIEPISENFEM